MVSPLLKSRMANSSPVNLVDQGDGTTLMKYEGDLQNGGTLAA
jgi:hypothetical protein